MAEAKTIKFLKREALEIFRADDPTTVPAPSARAVLALGKGNEPTGNWAHVAACCGLAAPQELFTLGEGWGGDHHGGAIGEAGLVRSGINLMFRAIFAEVDDGLCGGGREFLGYKHAYLVGDLLVLRHGGRHERELAARAIATYLALDYLLTVPGTGDVIEIGGRATGKKNTYSAVLQALWRGDKDVRVPESDAAIACKMFEALTSEERALLPAFPSGVEDAVAILEWASVVCPAEFEWTRDGSRWATRVKQPREWFIDKRTGERALAAASWADERDDKGRPIHGRPDGWWPAGVEWASWHLTLGAEGLQVHRRPGGEGKTADPDKPTPKRPEKPEPPGQEPDLAAGVRAVIAWAKDPASAKGRGAKSVLGEVAERLGGLL